MVMVHKGKVNWEAAVYDCIGLAGGKQGGQEGESLCTRTRIWAAHIDTRAAIKSFCQDANSIRS